MEKESCVVEEAFGHIQTNRAVQPPSAKLWAFRAEVKKYRNNIAGMYTTMRMIFHGSVTGVVPIEGRTRSEEFHILVLLTDFKLIVALSTSLSLEDKT
jgi:hypothetical protein